MNKVKTYAFWLALSSAVVILIQSFGKLFGFEIESSIIENVIMSICGVLVVLGIVTKKSDDVEESADKNSKEVLEDKAESDAQSDLDKNIGNETSVNDTNNTDTNILERRRDME